MQSVPPPTFAPPAPPASVPAPAVAGPWPWWLGIVGAPAALLVTLVAAVPLVAAAGTETKGHPGLSIALQAIQEGGFILTPLLLAGAFRRPQPRDFGLARTRFWPAVAWAVAAAVTVFAFTLVWSQVAHGQKQDDLFKELGVGRASLSIGVLALLVCVAAPFAEEFLFRGFCYGALRAKLGVAPSAVLVGLVFGAFHATSTPPLLLVELAVFGAVLCVVRERTGSLLPCIALHAINNSIAFGGLVHWDWQIVPLALGALALLSVALAPVSARAPAVAAAR